MAATNIVEDPAGGIAPRGKSAQRELARAGLVSFIGAAMSAVLGFAVIIVLGRMLGDVGSGVVLQVIAVFTIALGLARFGMDSTALWILPRLRDDSPGQIRRTLWFLVSISGVVGTICAAAMMFAVPFVASTEPSLASAIQTTAPFLPAAAMLLTALSATRALGRISAYVWVGNIGLPAMRPLAIAGAIGFGASYVGAAVAWALPSLIALGLALVVLFSYARTYPQEHRKHFKEQRIARRAVSYALPRVASASLEQVLIWVAVLCVGAVSGASAAGVYGAASRFIAAGLIVDTSLRVVVAPMFSRHQNRNDHSGTIDLYQTATIWLVLFSTPVFILLAIFGPVALSVIGPEFTVGASALIVMCAGALATLFAGNVHSVLLMSGRSGLAALNKLIVVLVTVFLILLLAPRFGIIGAAIAWTTASVLDALLALIEVRFLLKLRISLWPGLYPFCVGALSVGLPAILIRLTLGATWIGLALAVAIGSTAFFLLCKANQEALQLREFALVVRRRHSSPQQVSP